MGIEIGTSRFRIWSDYHYAVNFGRLNRSVPITVAVRSKA
jgi:hypothetical protein